LQRRGTHPERYLALLLVLLLIPGLPVVRASTEYSIPVYGRFATLTIGIQIPETPKWAHDVVLNATIAWNHAQLWYQHNIQSGPVYTFVETSTGPVTVNFTLPSAYLNFVAAWTAYDFSLSSKTSIISAQVYLPQNVFSQTQQNNSTARHYAFRLALHELGHVLGLGQVIDGRDIMDPRGPTYLATQQPLISTLDLYAIHTLATATSVSTFITLPSSVTYQLIDARTFLTA
jgi:hypothetical protein